VTHDQDERFNASLNGGWRQFTASTFARSTARVITQVREAGRPVLITRHGRVIAVARALTPSDYGSAQERSAVTWSLRDLSRGSPGALLAAAEAGAVQYITNHNRLVLAIEPASAMDARLERLLRNDSPKNPDSDASLTRLAHTSVRKKDQYRSQ
jgi:antitoxin (DNA-binding transcriptional repressor) of toxin-antitoxin stability system